MNDASHDAPRVGAHHAYLYVGAATDCYAALLVQDLTHPDVEQRSTELFTIDDARVLREKSALRPVASDARVFVVSCERMTPAAQNALLKLFEDPPGASQFHLIVPREDVLIETLQSRLVTVFHTRQDTVSDDARAFLRASYAARLAQIATLHTKKDTTGLRSLLQGVEIAVAQSERRAAHPVALRELVRVASYAPANGASLKMLMEHLALTLPSRTR